MENSIEEIIDELGVDIVYKDFLDEDGHYIACINTVVLSPNLDEIQERCVLLHELGHAAKHQDNYVLYNRLLGFHLKMENEAEEFMIEKLFTMYVNNPDINPDIFNSIYFLNIHELDLSYEAFVKDLFTEYFTTNIII